MAHDRLLFIGRPDASEVAQWSALLELAPQRGWKPTRKFAPGEVAWAVAANSALTQPGPAAEVIHSLREAQIPCTTAGDAIRNVYPDS